MRLRRHSRAQLHLRRTVAERDGSVLSVNVHKYNYGGVFQLWVGLVKLPHFQFFHRSHDLLYRFQLSFRMERDAKS